MKYIVMILVSFSLVGCGTLGGALSGAGQDLQRVGDWVQSK
jgi:predicted small secreted protein